MRVYLAGPITGLTMEQSLAWRRRVADALPPHIGILDPLRYPDEKWVGQRSATDVKVDIRAIVRRNEFDVRRSDIVFANFEGSFELSVGTIVEMALGHGWGKGIICCCPETNIHYRPHITQIADIVFENLDPAIQYLRHMVDEAQNLTFGEPS